MGIKTENLPRKTRFSLWLFYNGVLSDDHLSKATTFEWSQKWLSYTGLTVIVFAKNIILSIWQDSEYVSVLQAQILLFYKKKIFYKKILALRQAQDILRIFNTHNLFYLHIKPPSLDFLSILSCINKSLVQFFLHYRKHYFPMPCWLWSLCLFLYQLITFYSVSYLLEVCLTFSSLS